MKKMILLLVIAVATIGASAQIRFGVKAGVGLNSVHFNNLESNWQPGNRTGFTGGVMCEIGLPLTGLCVDGSLMYTHRSASSSNTEVWSRDYVSIPVNLKYKLSIVGVGKVFAPYVFTGPEFAFRISKKDESSANANAYSKSSVGWNVGLGVELFSHLQVSGSYGFGISNSIKDATGLGSKSDLFSGKDRYWTITAAFLF